MSSVPSKNELLKELSPERKCLFILYPSFILSWSSQCVPSWCSSFMTFSMWLMLKLLLLKKQKVILTSFLMTLRSSSRFTIRNFTGHKKKITVKHSGCNMSLHKSASPVLCFSLSICLGGIQIFPQTAVPTISHSSGLWLEDLYAAVGCRISLPLPGNTKMKCLTAGVGLSAVCLYCEVCGLALYFYSLILPL